MNPGVSLNLIFFPTLLDFGYGKSRGYGLAVLCKPVEDSPALRCWGTRRLTTDTRFHSSLIKDPREAYQRFFDLQCTVFCSFRGWTWGNYVPCGLQVTSLDELLNITLSSYQLQTLLKFTFIFGIASIRSPQCLLLNVHVSRTETCALIAISRVEPWRKCYPKS
jgi:hypothetical protein